MTKVISIETKSFKVDGGAMFGVVPKKLWSKIYDADTNNMCTCANRSLLVDTGEKKILIDTGIGTKQSEKFLKHYHLGKENNIEDALINSGYNPGDITDVILTHLHWDHCGGLLKFNNNNEIISVFPNAKIWCTKQQWDWANKSNKREKPAYPQENIELLNSLDNVNFIEDDFRLCKEVELRIFYGHTQGLMLPFININGKQLLFAGDLIPVMANIPSVYISAYDILPLSTLEEKEEVLEEICKNNGLLFFQHDEKTECCNIKLTEKGYIPDKIGLLKEFL